MFSHSRHSSRIDMADLCLTHKQLAETRLFQDRRDAEFPKKTAVCMSVRPVLCSCSHIPLESASPPSRLTFFLKILMKVFQPSSTKWSPWLWIVREGNVYAIRVLHLAVLKWSTSTKTHKFNRLHEGFQLYANLEFCYGHSAVVEWLGDSSYLEYMILQSTCRYMYSTVWCCSLVHNVSTCKYMYWWSSIYGLCGKKKILYTGIIGRTGMGSKAPTSLP